MDKESVRTLGTKIEKQLYGSFFSNESVNLHGDMLGRQMLK